MKNTLYTTTLIFLLSVTPVRAQTDFITPSAEVMGTSVQSLFAQYLMKNKRGDIQQTALLDLIYSKTLPATQENTNNLIQAYSTTDSEGQKISLLRLLGQMYDNGDIQVRNTAIYTILSAAQDSHSPKIAAEAVRIYSESGYFPNTLQLLNDARSSKIIDDEDYNASLAKLILIAPSDAIEAIVKILSKGSNLRALDILTLTFASPSNEAFTHDSKKAILEILEKNEPEFPEDRSRMGGLDAVRYDTWLNAAANLSQSVTGEDRNLFINRKLSTPNIDERKLVAFFISSPEQPINFAKQNHPTFEKMKQAVTARARAYPDDSLTAEARHRLGQ